MTKKIFVASTGRCGTVFMSEIFKALTDFPSFHEPEPWCVGQTLKEINTTENYSEETHETIMAKIAQIKRDSRNGDYFESNQMFIKSYLEPVLANFGPIYCIYLHRNPIQTTISYAKKCRRFEGEWFLKSHWSRNHLQTQEELPFYENAMWQCYEIRERFYRNRARFEKTFIFDFRKLNDPDEWKRLFKEFKIEHRPFEELPIVRRNEIPGDDDQVLQHMLENWDSQPMAPSPPGSKTSKEMKYIDYARRLTMANAGEMQG